ncbi:putative sugar nucleotidyl transferase [Candidatus Laterigemmans baculatus]|uniref:putative sugar nucleotidyl transferase n=1 Tax=Candidatus Laterigemmans baculatus TaxID=2770505 RepID=UPI0013DD121F|nr:putative sugar nucleotidyl transferase [Candidatus Laterigemmans baculatus]
MKLVVFEDEAVAALSPVITARPAYAITCASYRLIDWLRTLDLPLAGLVRPHLRTLQTLDFGVEAATETMLADAPLLAVNARVVPSRAVAEVLRKMLAARAPGVIYHGGHVAAAYLAAPPTKRDPATESDPPAAPSAAEWSRSAADRVEGGGEPRREVARLLAAAAELPRIEAELPLFDWPHRIVAENLRLMNESLEARLASGQYRELQDGVFVAAGATLGDYPVIDTSHGPILLDETVRVGPFCYLSGPVYAGPRTRVIEHAALKDAVSLGHTVKIGGEVEASVIEPYSNKQHHGFLGHSYLGSWINLGAGTCNSDLKNTYGAINMQYGSQRIATEMQFMGCIMGDYTKTAINTGIFTGKVVGVCGMLYGFVTSNVPSFVNYARLFGQTAELPPEVMIATQQRMFARRNVEQRECDQQLIRDMHQLTEHEREGQLGAL